MKIFGVYFLEVIRLFLSLQYTLLGAFQPFGDNWLVFLKFLVNFHVRVIDPFQYFLFGDLKGIGRLQRDLALSTSDSLVVDRFPNWLEVDFERRNTSVEPSGDQFRNRFVLKFDEFFDYYRHVVLLLVHQVVVLIHDFLFNIFVTIYPYC